MTKEENYEEEWDFVQSHKKIPVNLIVAEPCTDAISRQAALRQAINAHKMAQENGFDFKDICEEYLNVLPPVTPQPKVGWWTRELIRNEYGGCIGAKMICSECGQDNGYDKRMKFCPNCGQPKMQEVEDG